MVMLAICRIQRPVSLEFGASVVCGGVCVCGGTSRAIVGDINLVEPLVSLLGLFWVLPFPSFLVSHVRSPRFFPVRNKNKK